MNNDERPTKLGNETLDWDSYPKFGSWYYIVPAAMALICLWCFLKPVYLHYKDIQEWIISNGGEFKIQLKDILTYSPEVYVYTLVILNFAIAIYHFCVRKIKKIVYKKDPLRWTVMLMSIVNTILVPLAIVLSNDSTEFNTDFMDDMILTMFLIPIFAFPFVFPMMMVVFEMPFNEKIRPGSYSSYYLSDSEEEPADEHYYPSHKSSGGLFGGFSSKRDYIGSHGEFEQSDRERAYNEDIFSFRQEDKNFDASEHFGWEHELNYDSDGYRDEE